MLRKIRTGVAFALLVGAAFAAQAAGLGRLTVQSTLGQVLAAEIDLVSLQPGELDALTARVASPESYRDAKIEYSAVLRLLRFSVEKRANGAPYLKLTSVAPINEPFVDVLVEVTWPSGRLQREYPILLDPPGFAEARAAVPAAAPPAPAPVAAAPAPAPVPAVPSAKAEMPAAAPARASGDSYGPVERGEYLNKIAREVKPATVSMEQMLVALYRENRTAFIDNNMNRLKAGQILRVPSAEEAGGISGREAIQEIRSHVANWKAYREGLAGGIAAGPARGEPARAASGPVGTAAVSPPPAPPAASGDVLKLSKTEGTKATAAGKAASPQDRLNALQEELTAKDKALGEAQSRLADLEKQIRDMQRLIELKTGAPPKPAEPAAKPEPKVDVAAKPADAPKPVEMPAPVEATKTAEAPKPADSPKPAETPKPAPPKPAAKKPAPPPPPPSFMDELLDNPLMLAAGAGVVGLLGVGGFLFVRNRRRKANVNAVVLPLAGGTSSQLRASSGSAKPAGGLVDTGNSSFLTDFDKEGTGATAGDEVDPVAEAEVYIAYGRDAQAEEILKDARTRDKNRHEVTLKLLEIYHARKSAPAFAAVATELRAAVGESSPVWKKAAAMGAQIDTENALYKGAMAAGAPVSFETAAPAPRPDLDFNLDAAPGTGSDAASAEPSSSFDLDLGSESTPPPDLPLSSESPALDFDLSPQQAPAAESSAAQPPAEEERPSFDFDLSGLDFPSSPATATPAAPTPDAGPGALEQTTSLNLADLDLGGGGSASDAFTTKLELAKAYIEIGDKDGAREILKEVAKGGSVAQQAEAKQLIDSL